jgi:hypothetical protein
MRRASSLILVVSIQIPLFTVTHCTEGALQNSLQQIPSSIWLGSLEPMPLGRMKNLKQRLLCILSSLAFHPKFYYLGYVRSFSYWCLPTA